VRRTGNPILNERTFGNLPRAGIGLGGMTLKGTVDKSFLLLIVLMAAALWPWSQLANGDVQAVSSLMTLGFIGGFIAAIVVAFKPAAAPYLAIPYAALEGLALGGISALFEQRYHGIALEAVGLTCAVLLALLIAYRTGLIRVTERVRAMVVAATFGVVLFYAATWILSLFHVSLQALYAPTPLGIGVSLVIVAIAAFNVVLSFDLIDRGVAGGAPKYMEWYCAVSLMVSLVWLYLEMLRLLALTRRN
jgi:uncharacterized YccA/Bax inhibitor family protein